MPGYKPQVKSESGEMVDIPIAATYDENGNEIKKYVSTFSQTFTDEEKAQARANIGVAGGKVYRHCVSMRFLASNRHSASISFDLYINTPTPITSSNIFEIMGGIKVVTNGVYFSPTSSAPEGTPKPALYLSVVSGDMEVLWLGYNEYTISDADYAADVGVVGFSASAMSSVDDVVQEMP